MNFAEFVAQPDVVRGFGNWLADLAILDASGAAVAPPGEPAGALRACTRLEGFATLPTDSPANAIYWPTLAPEHGGGGGLNLAASLWSGGGGTVTFGGSSLPNAATLVLGNRDGRYDPYSPYKGYRWDGQRCTMRFGSAFGLPSHPHYMARGDFRSWHLTMGEPVYSLTSVSVPLYGLDRRFDQPLSKLRFRGTGGCLQFASGAYSTHGTPAKLDLTGGMACEGWLWVDNLSAVRRLIGWRGGTRTPFQVNVSTAGALQFVYTHSGGTSGSSTTTDGLIAAGRWIYYGISISGTAGTFLVYDGLTGGETVETFTTAAATRDANVGGTFQISANSATNSWVGAVDEQRIWNGARTLSQFRAHRYGPLDAVPSACVGYFKHDDGAGSFVTSDDGSGTAADGTLNGTVTWIHSLTGSDSLAGQIRPDRWGWTQYQPCVLVDETDQIYEVASSGAVQKIEPCEGMNPLVEDAGGDIASPLALSSTSVAAGTYRTCLGHGKFKLGSRPTLPVTAHVEGYTAGGYVETKGGINRRIITGRGEPPAADPGDLDTAAYTALDTADNSKHGLAVTGEEISVRTAVDRVMGPGAWWGLHLDSDKFTVAQWAGVAVTADYTIPTSRILRYDPAGDVLRYWRVRLRYGGIFQHSLDQISADISDPVGGANFSASLVQRALLGWSEALAEDYDTLADHPDAQPIEWDTQIQWPDPGVTLSTPVGRDAAADEADRILTILKQGYQPWRFVLDAYGTQFRLGQTIAPVVEVGGVARNGFDGTRRLAILALDVDPLTWNVEVVAVG